MATKIEQPTDEQLDNELEKLIAANLEDERKATVLDCIAVLCSVQGTVGIAPEDRMIAVLSILQEIHGIQDGDIEENNKEFVKLSPAYLKTHVGYQALRKRMLQYVGTLTMERLTVQ